MIRPMDHLHAFSIQKDGPKALEQAAREMESLFLYELLKVMRQGVQASSDMGFGGSIYTSMFDVEVARILSERGIGLKEMLIRGMNKIGAYTPIQNRPEQPALLQDSIVPAEARPRISSGYGIRIDPFDKTLKYHHGIDIAVPEGTEIRPVRPGTVIYSGEQKGYGNVVAIAHKDGYVTLYAHNKENLVQAGERVETSTVIARAGSTGRATGPHVHFEARFQGERVDPSGLVMKEG